MPAPSLAPLRARTTDGADLDVIARPPVDLEIVIPAYNEEHRLPATLARTSAWLASRPWSSRIVVVDNGSVDATSGLTDGAAAVEVRLTGCAVPGKGAAVRRGMLTSRAGIVGFMDADLATPVDTLDAVVQQIHDGADVVIGSRYVTGARFAEPPTPARRVGSAAFRTIGRQLAPGIADTQCGFKFLRGGVAADVLRRCATDGFAFDLELLAHSVRGGYDVREVPVHWTAQPGSTFRPLRDGGPSFAAAIRLLRDLGPTAPVAPRAQRAGA